MSPNLKAEMSSNINSFDHRSTLVRSCVGSVYTHTHTHPLHIEVKIFRGVSKFYFMPLMCNHHSFPHSTLTQAIAHRPTYTDSSQLESLIATYPKSIEAETTHTHTLECVRI